MQYNTGMLLLLPPYIQDHLLAIHVACAVWYLGHFMLAWRFWPAPLSEKEWPHKGTAFATSTSIVWKLMADGGYRLTKGWTLFFCALAFVPGLIVVLAYFDAFFTAVRAGYLFFLRVRSSIFGRWLAQSATPIAAQETVRVEPHLQGESQ